MGSTRIPVVCLKRPAPRLRNATSICGIRRIVGQAGRSVAEDAHSYARLPWHPKDLFSISHSWTNLLLLFAIRVASLAFVSALFWRMDVLVVSGQAHDRHTTLNTLSIDTRL